MSNSLLKNLTIKRFHQGLLNKEFSVFEVAKEFFSYIKQEDKKINAYLSLNEESSLKQAKKLDSVLAKSKEFHFLTGVPLAVKDNILIEGLPATAASRILENYIASYDATVIRKLKEAGAIFIGKTNLDEFAMGSSTENSAFKKTYNPFDLERVPGGSSGGSAAAVAAHLAVAALGSDTGGSIRQPAAFCGAVGLKPTYGSVSRYGLIAMASSLDQIGPITKTVEDAAILFEAIAGYDEFDATSVDYNFKFTAFNLAEVRNLKIGIPKEYFIEGLDKKVVQGIEEVISKFKNLKIKFKEISLPYTKYALSVYYIIMPAEVSANLARYDGIRYGRKTDSPFNDLTDLYMKNRGEGFGLETKRRILLGSFVLSTGYYEAYYTKAQKVRQLIKNDFDEAFKEVDVILTPVTPTVAFKIGEKSNDPLQMYLSDIFTIPANLAGLPAISIPVRQYCLNNDNKQKELPVGFQLIGKHFHEVDILNLGQFYEKN